MRCRYKTETDGPSFFPQQKINNTSDCPQLRSDNSLSVNHKIVLLVSKDLRILGTWLRFASNRWNFFLPMNRNIESSVPKLSLPARTRVGRESERGAARKTNLLSPALSSSFAGSEGEENPIRTRFSGSKRTKKGVETLIEPNKRCAAFIPLQGPQFPTRLRIRTRTDFQELQRPESRVPVHLHKTVPTSLNQ